MNPIQGSDPGRAARRSGDPSRDAKRRVHRSQIRRIAQTPADACPCPSSRVLPNRPDLPRTPWRSATGHEPMSAASNG
jgi:hypothetical protein